MEQSFIRADFNEIYSTFCFGSSGNDMQQRKLCSTMYYFLVVYIYYRYDIAINIMTSNLKVIPLPSLEDKKPFYFTVKM